MATVQGAGGVYLEVLQTAELPANLWIQRLANSQGTTDTYIQNSSCYSRDLSRESPQKLVRIYILLQVRSGHVNLSAENGGTTANTHVYSVMYNTIITCTLAFLFWERGVLYKSIFGATIGVSQVQDNNTKLISIDGRIQL